MRELFIRPARSRPADLGASENDGDRARAKLERTQDTELPIAVDVVHIDEGRDYQSSTVTVRKQIGRSDSVTTFSLPLVLTVEQAQVIGQRALREMWQGREAIDLRLPTRSLALDPTDTLEVPVDSVVRHWRATAVTYGQPAQTRFAAEMRSCAWNVAVPSGATPDRVSAGPRSLRTNIMPIRARWLGHRSTCAPSLARFSTRLGAIPSVIVPAVHNPIADAYPPRTATISVRVGVRKYISATMTT